MAQCPAIGHVARALQKRIEQCIAESIAPSAAAFGELGNFCEVIYQQLDEYRDGKLGAESPELLARIAAPRWNDDVQASEPTVPQAARDRKSVAEGKRGAVRGDSGGSGLI